MSTSVARPNSTDVASGINITGAADMANCTDDDSDASYAYSLYGIFNLGFNEPSIPGGSVFKKLVLRMRSNCGTTGQLRYISVSGYATIPDYYIQWLTPTTAVVGEIAGISYPSVLFVSATLVSNDGVNAPRIHELYLDVVYVTQPTIVVNNPTGTITTGNAPQVTWTPTNDADGGAQTQARAKIFTAAQYGIGGFDPEVSPNTADSGPLSGAGTTWDVNVPLPNATYRAYVKTSQTVNGVQHWSAWDYEGFVMNTPLPAVPDLSATADSANGRITLSTEENSGTATTDQIQIEFSHDGGTTWEQVRTPAGDGRVDNAITTTYHYEAPNGVQASFRARAIHAYAAADAFSAWSSTATATWSSGVYWLKHPSQPSLNMAITLGSPATSGVLEAGRQGVFQPLSSREAVVISDTRSADIGQLKIRCDSDAARTALDAILADGVPLLLQTTLTDYTPDRWLALGDHNRTRLVDTASQPRTWEELDWIEVERPAGGLA